MVNPSPVPVSSAVIFPVVRDIIAEVLVSDPEEITQDTAFDEEDLDIINTPAYDRILTQVQKKFPDLQLELEMLRDCMTVAELVSLIEEEKEFAEM